MVIKVGDIVEYKGVRQRLMAIYQNKTTSLSKRGLFTFQPLSELTLIESVELPVIKTGDMVIIKNIPEEERWFACPRWAKGSSTVSQAVRDQQPFIVEDTDDGVFGPRAYLNIDEFNFGFCTYCLEKINHYDMI